jgi:hypothetical protein
VLSEQTDALCQSHQVAERTLIEEAGRVAVTRRLATASGISPIRAAPAGRDRGNAFAFPYDAAVLELQRLAIVTRSSSGYVRENGRWVREPTAQTRGLNRNRQPELKAIFTGAAMSVIQTVDRE